MAKPPKKGRTKALDAKAYLDGFKQFAGVELEDFALATDAFASISQVEETVPTGSIAIDRLTGGGWPVGRISEVAAWEGVGKSTLMDQSLAECQRMGGVACLIDTEQARDFRHMRALGVDLSKLLVVRAETVEDGFARIDQLLEYQGKVAEDLKKSGQKPPVMLIVWDSIGATPSNKESEGESDDQHVSAAARAIKMNLRRITQSVAKLRVCLVMTNHFYKDFMNSMGSYVPLKTYGGAGIQYHTSLRLFLKRAETIKTGGAAVGHVVEASLKKTRVNKPRPPAKAGLVYGCGIYNAWTLFEWGKTAESRPGRAWIEQRGAWSTLSLPSGTDERFQNSFVGLGEILTTQPDVYRDMVAAYFAEDIADAESPEVTGPAEAPEGAPEEEPRGGGDPAAALSAAIRGEAQNPGP